MVINVEVVTKQGIDFKVSVIKIPLYLKTLNFLDRHFNYKHLVKRITGVNLDQHEAVMKIFAWTYENIRQQPVGLPVVDDHTWNIIVRGYGLADQASDVFCTLCNYAGYNAFYDYISSDDGKEKIILSYVKINGFWYIFDPYNGIYFVDTKNMLVAVSNLKNTGWKLGYLGQIREPVVDYKNYLSNIIKIKRVRLRRENIQSPLRRLMFEFQKKQNLK